MVGAGIVGVCCGLWLQRDGHQVTLLDRQGPGEGASFGNASIFATESVLPVAMPGIVGRVPRMLADPLGPLAIRWGYLPRLAPWLLRFLAASRTSRVEAISEALAALLDGCLDDYEPLLAEAGLADTVVRRGWIGAHLDPAKLAGARPSVALQRAHGVEVEELGAAALRQLEPALSRALAGGFYYPEVAHSLDPYAMVVGLARRFVEDGGEIARVEARGLAVEEGRVVAVRTAAGDRRCDALVVAAGAWSRGLAAQAGAPVPLDTERGYHLTIPEPGVTLNRPIYSTEFGMACTPLATGLRLGGTVELGGLEAPPDWRRAEVLAARGRKLFPGLSVEGASRWMGFRPSMPDSLPVIGASPKLPNAFLAFGHGHLGLTLGARTGRLVADLVAGRRPVVDLTPYRPGRF
ncbi:D-amino-acid dehydrogenase [Tistlia consotensis]|uniref:D-amino-acid dehydrogenase n=1 Tax=Tistlia consotensis USBA 355 TaxID=560819 RepID=A0A1Y6BN54_9PROT|nr:D-amino-acid dehydrogenase [Tistlia consotensis USBA 355]SNR39868.1 D-amino-acid dehydrogenase [Tistlia consotensis]